MDFSKKSWPVQRRASHCINQCCFLFVNWNTGWVQPSVNYVYHNYCNGSRILVHERILKQISVTFELINNSFVNKTDLGKSSAEKLGSICVCFRWVNIMLSRYSEISYIRLSRDFRYALHMRMLDYPTMFITYGKQNSQICTHGLNDFQNSTSDDFFIESTCPICHL